MNRLGSGEGLMFFAFIFIMGILGAGIVWGVSSFFGAGYDGRAVEASTLMNAVENCFDDEFFSVGFDLSRKCGFNEQVIEDGMHFIFINRTSDNKIFTIGAYDYLNQCRFNVKDNPNYPVCVNSTFVKGGDRFEIVVGTNQRGRRVTYG